MQHIKSIKKLSEIDSRFAKANVVGDTFSRVLNQFRLSTINKLIGGCKSRGISAHRIFQTLFILPFIGKINISSLAQSGFTQYVIGGKDTYYEFLKNPQIPWRKIVLLFAWQFVLITRRKSHDQAANSPKRMIVDDTLLEKSGKKIEKIGKVFDHGSHKHPLGMKLLVLSWWDGKSMIPLNFSLHNEPRKDGSRGLKPKELKNQAKF